jgi:RNA polymerase sigma-32 factor
MSTLNLPITTDTFEHYMVQVNRFDLLTSEEEHELATRHMQEGDMEAAHKLVCANLRFVVKVANEYRSYGLRLLDLVQEGNIGLMMAVRKFDLVQEGNIGLMMAVRKFDPQRGTRLITYAVWWIRAYIQSYVMRSWSMVKIGTTQMQKKLFFKLAQTRKALRNMTGTEEIEDIARELDVTEDAVVEMTQRMGGRDTSLDVELTEGEGYTLLSTLKDDGDNQEELLLAHEEQQLNTQKTSAALSVLKPRERHIIEQRILAETPSTLQELANEYGISRERVRQIEQNALSKLRNVMAEHPS